jgi:hypothetical protein
MYDFNLPAGHNLVDISAKDTSGVGPQVRGVVQVADGGSQVYFVAGGLLSSAPNSLGQYPQSGADNLYRYDAATGAVAFIAELCAGQGTSGSVSGVAQCPGPGNDFSPNAGPGFGLTAGNSESDVTPDGRFLVFTTYAQLTPDDQNQEADVYEYDALTGGLWRVSVGHDGQDQNGNAGGQDATAGRRRFVSSQGGGFTVGLGQRAVSDDGQTVVFLTARPLQSTATNGQPNAYEWHQGEVALISGGQSPGGTPVFQPPAITPSGQDIVFVTDQGLLPQDTDGQSDVYDARIGGGFPLPPATMACQGDTCQGALSGAPAPPAIASIDFGPPNASSGSSTPSASARVLTRTVLGATFLVAVKVPGNGWITIAGAGIRPVAHSVITGGTYRLRVTLTPKARSTLHRRHRLKLRLHIAYAAAGSAASAATVQLTVRAR